MRSGGRRSIMFEPPIKRPGQAPPQPAISFSLGALVATPGALALDQASVLEGLRRHACGDWGNLCAEDIEANNRALVEGARLLSSYLSQDGTKFWIITEADRSATTVLLPDEY